ncbi:MAG: signal recognition particle protein, partial [Clostridia bacterium]|nr:signal recognition particle protein [Clostridia bacterium]
FLEQMEQMKSMGSMEEIMSMLPGMGGKAANITVDEKAMAHTAAIIKSMTKKERANPNILNASRRKRIAKGSGTSVQEVNRLVNQFEQTRKLMKQFSGSKFKRGRRGGFPFGF